MSERKMKDSGIDWANQVPEHWTVSRIKNHLTEINEKNNPLKMTKILSLTNIDGVIPYSERGNQGNKAKEDLSKYKVVYKETIVANSMNILIGSVGLSKWDGCVSPVYYVYKAKKNNSIRYFNYLFSNTAFQEELRKYANGIMDIRLRLSSDDILKRNVPIPPYEEQEAIANYLDEKCEKIDTTIKEAKKSIEEYNSLKKAIITNYIVGRGYDKRIEKGNKWFPKIPKGWNLFKTLRVLEMPITDGPHVTPELYSEGIPFVSAEAVSCGNGSIDFNHIRGYISQEFYEECCKKYIPKLDDIYMIKSGATTGRVSIVDTDKTFTIWSPLAVFRCNKRLMLPKYLFYMLQSEPYQLQVAFNWSFGTQQNIGMRTLEKLLICVPSLKEQENILVQLEGIIPKLNNLICEKESLIEDLNAYKKSLIYECVTGKKEVT